MIFLKKEKVIILIISAILSIMTFRAVQSFTEKETDLDVQIHSEIRKSTEPRAESFRLHDIEIEKSFEHRMKAQKKEQEQIRQNELTDTFEITAYTAGVESTGKALGHPQYGITYSGAKVKDRHTIAADISVLPLGTKVKIEGFETVFVVEDTGSAIVGNIIDIYMSSLDDALKWGSQEREVTIIK